MYLPFVRGRRFDLLAIRECSHLISASKILPIIEPVNLKDVKNFCTIFKNQNKPFILITNPSVGESKVKIDDTTKKIFSEILQDILSDYSNFIIGYQITQTSSLNDINKFISTYSDKQLAIIHKDEIFDKDRLIEICNSSSNLMYHIFIENRVSRYYKDGFSGNKVIIRDSMKKRKNAEYPLMEYFSDLPLTYLKEGYNGFGDLLIESLIFASGYRPKAVAIHLTFIRDENIWINHFISNSNTTVEDVAGKFMEAVAKLVDDHYKNPSKFNHYSTAIQEYINFYEARSFPQLGLLKKLSMRHHIELIYHYFINN